MAWTYVQSIKRFDAFRNGTYRSIYSSNIYSELKFKAKGYAKFYGVVNGLRKRAYQEQYGLEYRWAIPCSWYHAYHVHLCFEHVRSSIFNCYTWKSVVEIAYSRPNCNDDPSGNGHDFNTLLRD